MVGGQTIVVKKLKCFGAGESHIAEMLGDMMHRDRNPQINCTVQFGIITLHIIASAMDRAKAEQMAEVDERKLRGILGDLVFGVNDQVLAEVVGGQLADTNKTLAVAESCSGGLVAKLITDVQGASRYFSCGWVTYANEAKVRELGVPAELIERYGAVSEEVAAAMAKGALEKAGTDYALSLTGIAGPDGGSEQKPVGLVYIGIADKTGCSVEKYVFPHTRDFMRLRSAQTALNLLRLKLRI
jgi:nicotinamide-nucleotide amidase